MAFFDEKTARLLMIGQPGTVNAFAYFRVLPSSSGNSFTAVTAEA